MKSKDTKYFTDSGSALLSRLTLRIKTLSTNYFLE